MKFRVLIKLISQFFIKLAPNITLFKEFIYKDFPNN